MAIIRVKRNNTAAGNLKSGEIGLSVDSLYFGPYANGDAGASAVKLANQTAPNTFSSTNIFQHGTDGTANVSFRSQDGTIFYQVISGRLQTATSFTFNDSDLVNKTYVDSLVQGLDIKASVVAASTVDIPGTYTTTNGGTFTFTSTGV